MKIPSYLILFSALLINLPTTSLAGGLGCQKSPSLKEAMPIIEAGLCNNPIQFLGAPVCNDWHAFQDGTAPRLAAGNFAVGATFRAELARNGNVAWSDQNEMYVLYNAGNTEALESIRLLDIEANSPEQEKEKSEYISSAFSGHRNEKSSLHKYIEAMQYRIPATPLSSSPDGMVSVFPCMTVYVRQNKNRIYALLSTKHETAYEIDSHPVIYFAVLTPP